MTPPAVTKLMSQPRTTFEPLLTCRKARQGKTMTMPKHTRGTPLLVQ